VGIITSFIPYCKSNFFCQQDRLYSYILIPKSNQDMWDVPIHRQKLPLPPPPCTCATAHGRPQALLPLRLSTIHTMASITSHFMPHFVICNSGFKVDSNLYKWLQNYGTYAGEVAKVHAIWRAWTRVNPHGRGGEFIQKISDGDDPDGAVDSPIVTLTRLPLAVCFGAAQDR
jgi:hypothetical protein